MSSNQEIILPGSVPQWDRARVLDRIIVRMIDGESLRAICSNMKKLPDKSWVLVDPADFVPNRTTILRWMNEDASFAAAIARARDLQADAHADDIVEIVNLLTTGKINPKAAAVAINAKQWLARQMRPTHWGPQESKGGNGSDVTASALKQLADKLPG